ncbi:MAG: hypothetical protein M1834_002408 [Cirrosporium novae-zelandiae]|nr:MAG: hypothetical protein M1834_002408 [Cirrosporium novae-zelandiae]
MEAVRGGGFLQRGLTKLYSDIKSSYENVAPPLSDRDDPELLALQRKYRIQKDRVVAWGLDWSRGDASESGDIDSSLDQAGLSDLAGSIMASIQEILLEAENLQRPRCPPAEKVPPAEASGSAERWSQTHTARAEDLLKDLTASIDTLYDLSRSRQMFMTQSPEEKIHRKDSEQRQDYFFPTPDQSSSRLTEYPLEQPSYEPPPYDPGQSTFARKGLDLKSPPLEDMSLLTLLQRSSREDSSHVPPLEDRFRLAFEVGVTIYQTRPTHRYQEFDSSYIILLPDDESGSSTNASGNKPHYVRKPAISTDLHGDAVSRGPAAPNIYRHPQDKRSSNYCFRKAYDIYTFGLILLEIGLWMPLESFWKMKYNNAMFKSRIEDIYVKKLSSRCGSVYMRAAQCCLSMADSLSGAISANGDAQSSASMAALEGLETLFYDSVLCRLQKCCAIDEDKPLPPLSPKKLQEKAQLSNDGRGKVPITRTEAPPVSAPFKTLYDGFSANRVEEKVQPKPTQCLIWPRARLPKMASEDWNKCLMRRLGRILDRLYSKLPECESGSAGPFMVGDSPNSARPTILVECSKCTEVFREILERHLKINRDIWDLIVVDGKARFSMAPRKKRKNRKCKQPILDDGDELNLNPAYVERPSCGASIGACVNGAHHPPVSFGGTLLVDGQPLGMTVHHMLEEPVPESDDENDAESSAGEDEINLSRQYRASGTKDPTAQCIPINLPAFYRNDKSTPGNGDSPPSLSTNPSTSYSDFQFSDIDLSDLDLSDDESEPDDDNSSIGETPGVSDLSTQTFFVTQPALDDVHESFFPSPEDRASDHLCSHLLGTVHASSGIRHLHREGLKHEVDWALIDVNEDRRSGHNCVPDGGKFCHVGQYPVDMLRLGDLDALEVHCCGRTSGVQEGFLMGTRLIKMPGRSFSTSWCISGDFGGPGDSGAWIFDNETGNLCGHVLGWSPETSLAYMIPMQILLEDIMKTLGAKKISLVGRPERLLMRASSPPFPPTKSSFPTRKLAPGEGNGSSSVNARTGERGDDRRSLSLMEDLAQGLRSVKLDKMAERSGDRERGIIRRHVPSLA